VWGLRVKAAHRTDKGDTKVMSKRKKKIQPLVRLRALAVLARMRSRGESLSQAARAEQTTPRTVQKVVGKQLKREASGHYSPMPNDTLRRDLSVLGYDGYESVVVRSSKQARLSRSVFVEKVFWESVRAGALIVG
jgi:hypothetical protein